MIYLSILIQRENQHLILYIECFRKKGLIQYETARAKKKADKRFQSRGEKFFAPTFFAMIQQHPT
ncbi:MAG: hypothetical protein D6680_12560 [Cyanobacteria bacterium J007]|nr:MAG: hypothetical protein D6680_12560 [Cyanobacteria bacterium J007]